MTPTVPKGLPTAPVKNRSRLTDNLAIVGYVILGVIIIWGLLHIINLSSPNLPSLSSLFQRQAKVQVTAPAHATSGTPFSISWKYDTKDQGYYAFLYSCESGLQFKTAAAGGTGMINIPCGAAFSVASAAKTMIITPTLTRAASVKAPLSIVFIPATATGTRVQGTASVTIDLEPITTAKSEAASEPVAPAKITPAPAPAKPAAKPVQASPADLSVHIVAIGIIDPSSGQFVNSAPMSPNDMVAVEFDIANVGGSASDSYYFDAQLPTQAGYTYNSPLQSSLAPGDHVLNTLRFTQVAQNGGIVSIQVDPSGTIRESAKGNNYASQAIGTMGYYPPVMY